jgi:hypothetical protein
VASSRILKVEILGDARDALKAFGQVGDGADGMGAKLATVGKAGAVAIGAIGGAAIGIGGALYGIGASFDDAFDQIRVGTGATGDALAGLQESFKTVAANTPASFGEVSTAITDLNQRLGLTGQPLEDLTTQFLNLSRITGTDVGTNVENITRLFGDWGVAVEDQSGTMDMLFRASQATGAGIDQLSQQAVQFGAPLRQMGFGFEETIALLGKFEQEGVNTELVMGSMRQALGRFARAGESAPDAMARLTDEIRTMEDPTAATARAMEIFGARAGPDMAAAIREGRFDLGELFTTITDGTDTINGAADDTADFAEKFAILKNKVLVALEPVATRVFAAVGDAMDRIIPIVEKVIAIFQEDGLGGVFRFIGDAFRDAWPDIRRTLGNLAEAFWQWVQDVTPPLLAALGRLLQQLGEWIWNTGLPWLRERLARWTEAFFAWAQEAIPPALRELGNLLGRIGEWVLDEGLPLLVEKLLEWGKAFIEWVGPMIGPLLLELGKIVIEINRWILTDALPKIISKLAEWAWAFIKWVGTDAIPGLLRELGALLVRIGSWIITDGIPKFVRFGADLATAMVDKIVDFFTGLPGRMGSVIADMRQLGRDFARAMVNGLIAIWNRADLRFPRIEVPSWVPGIGNRGFGGFDVFPDVPYLADGGIVTRPTLAVIGEAGPEAVVPLSRGGAATMGASYAITVNALDPQAAGRAVVDAIRSYERSNGKSWRSAA